MNKKPGTILITVLLIFTSLTTIMTTCFIATWWNKQTVLLVQKRTELLYIARAIQKYIVEYIGHKKNVITEKSILHFNGFATSDTKVVTATAEIMPFNENTNTLTLEVSTGRIRVLIKTLVILNEKYIHCAPWSYQT